MCNSIDIAGHCQAATAASQDGARHELLVDLSERHAALVGLASKCDDFDVRMERLTVGDYCLDHGIVVERKTYAGFAVWLADGRLFPQAAKLARCPHRPVILLEGPRPPRMPDVHPQMASLAIMWRLPVLWARDPEESLAILRLLGHQLRSADRGLKRTTASQSVSLPASSTCCKACPE